RHEGELLIRDALAVGLEHDLRLPTLRGYNNLASTIDNFDRFEEELELAERGIEVARRYGDRAWEFKFLAGEISLMVLTGRWDEAVVRAADVQAADDIADFQGVSVELVLVVLALAGRGDVAEARAMLK